MYDPNDFSSPRWVNYRRFRLIFWLMLVSIIPVCVFAPVEFSFIFGLAFFAYSLGVPYVPCPVCNKPVGRGDGLIYNFIQASPWGGHCRSCGAKLFNRGNVH